MKPSLKSAGAWIWVAVSLVVITGFTWRLDQPQTALKIRPEASQVKVGEVVTIDITVEQVSGLYGVEVHLRFDPDALEVVDADPAKEGIQLEPGTLPIPDFVVLNNADNSAGTIDYAATQLPPNDPGEGDGIVAKISFKAKKAATSEILFERFLLADTTGHHIEATSQNGQIRASSNRVLVYVGAAGVVLLLGIGGLGLLWKRRKRD